MQDVFGCWPILTFLPTKCPNLCLSNRIFPSFLPLSFWPAKNMFRANHRRCCFSQIWFHHTTTKQGGGKTIKPLSARLIPYKNKGTDRKGISEPTLWGSKQCAGHVRVGKANTRHIHFFLSRKVVGRLTVGLLGLGTSLIPASPVLINNTLLQLIKLV